jgi:3-oxoacyl-[acyl-carrier protein] reductase
MELTMGQRGRTQPRAYSPDHLAPRKISPLVVWLCTDAAREINGRTFHVGGDAISRLSEPKPERVIHHDGGWSLDALDAIAPTHLIDDLTNESRSTMRPSSSSSRSEPAPAVRRRHHR